MKRDLFLRAQSDLRSAKHDMSTGDEFDLCLAAYHIQQCVEKVLRSCLKECGIIYTKTHKIEELLCLLPEDQDVLSDNLYERLFDKAPILTEWETNTRYVEGYMVARKYVKVCYNLALELLDTADIYFKNLDVEASSQASMCDKVSTSLKRMHLDD